MLSSTTRALLLSVAGLATAQNITDDTYFYGQSPAVYPSPPMPGSSTWASAHAKAVALVAQMTLEEMANITVGYTPDTGCSGVTGSVPRLDWPGLCLSDAGNGLRNTDFVNSWPSGIHVAASWNKKLTYQRGLQMGGEFKTKGVHVALGPVVGPLGRIAESGRNWEGGSNDPYLAGVMAAETVKGIQDAGVTTSVKHFILNEQETNRNPEGNVSSVSSNIDEKTLHELYLWPFADAVHAGTGCIMCSYNRINNSYACQNSYTLNGLLKTELGFEGFVVSDWDAQHTGIASADAGLDVAMPNSDFWGVSGGNLSIAVNNGSLSASRLSDMATRLVATWYQRGQDIDFPEGGIGMPLSYDVPHPTVNARDPASKPVLFSGAVEGHVLVKNNNSALPLKNPKLLSIFGYDAAAPGTSIIDQEGLFGGTYGVGYQGVLDYAAFVSTGPPPPISLNGTMIVGGGSGANAPAYISDPFSAIQERAYKDDTALFWDFTGIDPLIDTSNDACLVFINAFATEGADRPGLFDTYSDTLVSNVAANCSNTIVTIHNAGVRLVEAWIDHPNVTAVIYAHLPGQDSGRALVSLLYGDENFSGKLPYSVAKNTTDYTNAGAPSLPEGEFQLFPQSNFTEGVYIDYRAFDKYNVTPRYEFGFGLSYTTFTYSSLSIKPVANASLTSTPPNSTIIEGGLASLWDTLFTVTATITNSGSVDGAEVAQLYIGIPGGPVKQLRGFSKVTLQKGASTTVKFPLMRRDLSAWDVASSQWMLQSGTYNVYVGASSRDVRLSGVLPM